MKIILICCCLSLVFHSFSQVTFNTTQRGDSSEEVILVSIVVKEAPPLISMQFAMIWDTAIWSYQGVEGGEVIAIDNSFSPEELSRNRGRVDFAWITENFLEGDVFEEGDTLSIGDHLFEIFHTPGHAPGLVFVNRKEKLTLMGDVLFQGSIGRTDLPGGNHQQLLDSIANKILPLGDDMQFVCGHTPPSTVGHEKATNPYLQNLS